MSIEIIKATGEKNLFSPDKLRASLLQAGANETLANTILTQIEATVFNGITSKQIYQEAFKLLRKRSNVLAARYNIKRGVMELGPSGYPFEQYMGEIFKFHGYTVEVGVNVQGHCLQHEVDVVGRKGNLQMFCECKFRNRAGTKVDSKVALYIHSRYLDLVKRYKQMQDEKLEYQMIIMTNTRFSEDAKKYGNCMNMKLVGWDYPQKGNLNDWIEISGLYPLTCLTTLTKAEKRHLLERKVVLARTLAEQPALLDTLRISTRKLNKVIKEATDLCLTC